MIKHPVSIGVGCLFDQSHQPRMLIQGKRPGFSLTELLVVIGILGLLASLVLPAVMNAREAANKTSCINNLRQVATALHHYHGVFNHIPPQATPKGGDSTRDPNRLTSWRVLLCPFMDQENLWKKCLEDCETGGKVFTPPYPEGLFASLKPYQCPSDPSYGDKIRDVGGLMVGWSTYVGVGSGVEFQNFTSLKKPGIFTGSSHSEKGINFSAITDGLSNTLMLGERPPPEDGSVGQWYYNMRIWISEEVIFGPEHTMDTYTFPLGKDPCDGAGFGPGKKLNPCDRYHFWSLHYGGSQFAMGDGSVRFLPYSMKDRLSKLASIAGGEPDSAP